MEDFLKHAMVTTLTPDRVAFRGIFKRPPNIDEIELVQGVLGHGGKEALGVAFGASEAGVVVTWYCGGTCD